MHGGLSARGAEPGSVFPQTAALARAALLRHVALLVAVATAFAWQDEWGVPRVALWLLIPVVLVDLLIAILAPGQGQKTAVRWLSLGLSLAAWGTLIALTRGAESPFVVGIWLEMTFSVVAFGASELLPVGALALAALWTPAALAYAQRTADAFPSPALQLQSALLATFSVFTVYVVRHWSAGQARLALEAKDLAEKLSELEKQIELTRTFGQMGEVAARQAHQFKGLVCSLRGFLKLLEPEMALDATLQRHSIEGLTRTIEHVESYINGLLRPGAVGCRDAARTTQSEVLDVVSGVERDIACAYQGVQWVGPKSILLPDVAFPASALREVMLVLTENAAQASGAGGTISVKLDSLPDSVRLIVEDDGPGLESIAENSLFQWGVTTKAQGHGSGLYLSKRLVESLGGALHAAPRVEGGMSFSVTMPLCRG